MVCKYYNISIIYNPFLDAPCKWTADIESGNLNAMTKIWVQDYLPLSKTEEGLLGGLVYSPVAFGSYISDNIFGYSGGELRLNVILVFVCRLNAVRSNFSGS